MTTATLIPTLDTTPRTAHAPEIETGKGNETETEAARASEAFRGGVGGGPRVVLRLEGALVLAAALLAYARLGGGWGWFAALFLLPDLTMLGYLAGSRIGAGAYNAGHSYVGPALIAAASVALGAPVALLGATIWVAHIGFDRMMGYGLKYATAFGDTHLGRVGRGARR